LLNSEQLSILTSLLPFALSPAKKATTSRTENICARSWLSASQLPHSRDRHGDVVWLVFMAPHRHLVDMTDTSARRNTNVPCVGARLPLPGSLALGAQHGKLNADLLTSALLGTPSLPSVHDYYPFALEDGDRLAPMAVELVDGLAILMAIRHLPRMGVAHSRSLRSDTYVCM
jgi:hypothetical protein